MERVLSRWTDPLRVVAALLFVLTGVGALSVALGPGRFTTYAGTSTVSATATFAAGASLIVAGLTSSVSRRGVRSGDLAVLAGFTWFLPVLVGWQEGPPLVRSFSAATSAFTVPLVLHLVLVHPRRRAHRALERVVLLLVYTEAGAVAVVLALFQDPFLDPSCFANCSVNTFLVHSFPALVQAMEVTHWWFTAGTGVLLAGAGAARILLGSSATRRRLLPVALPAILVGVVVLSHAVAVGGSRIENPSDRPLAALYVAACVAMLLLASGLVTAVALAERQRRAVARIVSDLDEAPAPGDVEAALRQALADPSLRVAYWLTESQRYVDANGRPVPFPATGSSRSVTSLTREGRTVAMISHSGPLLEERLGPSLRLGLDNERLQAEVLAQLAELRSSRARVVEIGDLERRRLERDLHDGAQQRLLGLSFDVRLAHAAAAAGGDDLTASNLRLAAQSVQNALDELRELARGIFPASLADLGLEAALRTLAEFAPLPVQVRFTGHHRFPPAVESAAYFAVADAVQDAMRRSAGEVAVLGSHDGGRLVISIQDDGVTREGPLLTVTDRIGALGGLVLIDRTTCRLEIPCG